MAAVDARGPVVAVMVRTLCSQRGATVVQLDNAAVTLFVEIGRETDHRRHWDSAVAARRAKGDLFDRIRWSVDELLVLGTQMANLPVDIDEALALLAILVEHEETPLERLEREVPTVQLHRRWYPDLHAALLPMAVRAMRHQHTVAASLCDLFDHLDAA